MSIVMINDCRGRDRKNYDTQRQRIRYNDVQIYILCLFSYNHLPFGTDY
jgi:hypothetical protein